MRTGAPHYLTLTAVLAADAEEALSELLADWPVLGCEVRGEPGGLVRVVVYFEPEQAAAAEMLGTRLADQGAVEVSQGALAAEDWLAPYRSQVRPFPLGRTWWIDPHPETPTPAPPGRRRLVVEPRMAFGSGSHESTQLLLLELEDAPPEGIEVLDVGTGSGILALGAQALGAARVVALDVDLGAVLVAHQTAALQGSERRPLLLAGPVAALGTVLFPLVLCNMIPGHFTPLLADLTRLLAPGGVLRLSGLLAEQLDGVTADVEAHGLAVVGERRLGEWRSLTVVHA